MDNFDAIEDLVIYAGTDVNVLTGICLHGGLCAAWPTAQIAAKVTVECLLEDWREVVFRATRSSTTERSFKAPTGGPTAWADSLGCACR